MSDAPLTHKDMSDAFLIGSGAARLVLMIAASCATPVVGLINAYSNHARRVSARQRDALLLVLGEPLEVAHLEISPRTILVAAISVAN